MICCEPHLWNCCCPTWFGTETIKYLEARKPSEDSYTKYSSGMAHMMKSHTDGEVKGLGAETRAKDGTQLCSLHSLSCHFDLCVNTHVLTKRAPQPSQGPKL